MLAPTLILALWAAWWVTNATRDFTAEIQGDSAVYLSVAQGLRHDGLPTVVFNLPWDGFTPKQAVAFDGRVPATVYPPGYPAALAVTSVVAGSVRGAARTLDVVLIVVEPVVGRLADRPDDREQISDRGDDPGRVAAVRQRYSAHLLRPVRLVAAAPLRHERTLVHHILPGWVARVARRVHGRARRRARRALAVAVAASSAALLVRYVGIAFILAAVIALVVLDRQRNLRSRLRRAGIFAGIAVAPTALFAAWARLDGGGYPTSKLYSQAIDLRAPFDRFADYVLPLGGPHALRFLIIVVMLVLVVVGAVWGPGLPGASPEDDHNARYLVQLGLLYIGTYVLFVVVTALVFDLAVPIDARIFAPVRALWYAVLLAVAYRSLVRVVSSVGTVAIIGALATLLVVANWSTTRAFLEDRPALPTRTPVAQAIIRIPRNALLVSNAPDTLYDTSGSGSIALPFLAAGKRTPEYERSMSQVVDLFDRRGGYLAMFRFPGNPITVPPELQQSLKMHLIAQSPAHQPTAQLYEIPPQASTSGTVASSP